MADFPTVYVWVGFSLDPATYAPGVYFEIGRSPLGDAVHLLAPNAIYVNLADRVRGISITRGRQYELDRIESGTCRITLENRDSALDPTNSDSPWYPNVVPMRRIFVTATWQGVTYSLFSGFVESWPPIRRGTKDSEVTVDCIDAIAVLQQSHLSNFYGWAFSGERISQVLDEVGWATADRQIDVGSSKMADADFTSGGGPSALEHMHSVADSELGLVFADGAGRIVFHDRMHRRQEDASTTAQGTFGNVAGDLPYVDISPSYDAVHIYNDIRLTVPDDPQEATAADTASQLAYWIRTLSRSTELYSWAEAQSQAAFLLSRYKDPHLRFDTMRIRPGPIGSLFPHALGREISDRVRVRHQPVGTPAPPLVEQDCFIEGIGHEINPPFSWETTWQLSTPSPADAPGMVIGDATLGQIGTTNYFVY